MDLNALLAQKQKDAAARGESTIEIKRMHSANVKSEKLELSLFPQATKDLLDTLAARVLDVDNSHTFLVGERFAGKSFLIDQLVHHIDEYSSKLKNQKIEFFFLTDIDMLELGNTENYRTLLNAIRKEFSLKDNEICFVTQSPDVALYVATLSPQCKILLEVNDEVISSLVNTESHTASREWASWMMLDVTEAELTKKELCDLLEETVVKRLNSKFALPMDRKMLDSFVNFVCRNLEGQTEKNDFGKVIMVTPVGVWATIVKHVVSDYNYNSNKKYFDKEGKTSFRKIMEKTLEECGELFLNSLMDSMGDGASGGGGLSIPDEIFRIIQNEGVKIAAFGGAPQATVESTPLQFSDMSTLNSRIKEKIMGQDEAVDKVCDDFIIPAAKLNDPNKPLRSFLFMGPTGVGKTQLALEIANQLSTSPMKVVRIDMSEYQQPHEVAKLFGSPPGYVGHDAGGILTNAVAANPHAVVLLDEIEKAAPNVWDSFLQVLDSGRMTDSHGKVVDFTQTVVIMTSNVGAKEAARKRLGFGGQSVSNDEDRRKDAHSIAVRELEASFRPEFLNRIDDVVIFDALTEKTSRAIVRKEIDEVNLRLSARGSSIASVKESVVDAIIEKSDITKYGAREVQRIVLRNVSTPVAHYLLKNPEVKSVDLSVKNGVITVTKSRRKQDDEH